MALQILSQIELKLYGTTYTGEALKGMIYTVALCEEMGMDVMGCIKNGYCTNCYLWSPQ